MTDVHAEWADLVFFEGAKLSDEDRTARWQCLFGRTYVGGSWLVSPDDAWKVVSLGSTLAAQRGDFKEAQRLFNELLAHPEADQIDWAVQIDIHSTLARYAIALDQIDDGVAELRFVLDHPWKYRHTALHQVRSTLRTLFTWPPFCDPVPPVIAALIREVVGEYRGMKGHLRAAEDTPAGLQALVERSHGRWILPGRYAYPDDIRREIEAIHRKERDLRRRHHEP